MEQGREAGQVEEVYKLYGYAMLLAQSIERQLAFLLVIVNGREVSKASLTQFREMLHPLFDRTLGNLIHRLRDDAPSLGPLDFALREALSKRNWLAHEYFIDRAWHLTTEEGRKIMVGELDGIVALFLRIERELLLIVHNLAKTYGVEDYVRQEVMQGLGGDSESK